MTAEERQHIRAMLDSIGVCVEQALADLQRLHAQLANINNVRLLIRERLQDDADRERREGGDALS